MDPVLLNWLNNTITWEAFVSYDGRGKPTYAAPVSLKCFRESTVRIIRNAGGEEVVSHALLVIADPRAATIKAQDRITLPSGEQPPILRIEPLYDDKGNVDHYEVYL